MRQILILLLFLAPLLSLAQAQPAVFTLSPSGFSVQGDAGKGFIVLGVENMSKEDLFKKTLIYLNKTYASSKEVISQVENESITINAMAPKAVRRTNAHVFDLDYRILIEFRDNRIRIETPTFRLTNSAYSHFQEMFLVANHAMDGSTTGIWNRKGQLKAPLAKQDMETFFNAHIAELLSAINQTGEDW